ncbi:MAG: hypothetical protein KDD94_06100, partial [Calditrichaeota bacterium]|nr:hypothetical protein [Calditrichota bacterium]
MKRFVQVVIIFSIFACSDDPATNPEGVIDNDDFIITQVQAIPGTKINFSDLKSALNFTNLPASLQSDEVINSFLETGYLSYMEYFNDAIEILYPSLSNNPVSFINTSAENVKYLYESGVSSIYLIKHRILLPLEDEQYEDLFEADMQQNIRSAYIDIDL